MTTGESQKDIKRLEGELELATDTIEDLDKYIKDFISLAESYFSEIDKIKDSKVLTNSTTAEHICRLEESIQHFRKKLNNQLIK